MATDQLQALIAQAKTKGYTTTRTGTGGWVVEQVGTGLGRRPKFAARYRIAGDADLARVLARLIGGGKVGVGYETTLKPPSELPPLAADHGTRVWGPPRRG